MFMHSLHGILVSKPHNPYCYEDKHNIGRIALGNRICITIFIVF